MRLLYVTNGFPWPLTSGYLRHHFLLRELAALGHRITLLAVVGADFEPGHLGPVEPYTDEIRTFPSADRSDQRLAKAARRVTGEPAARAMADAVRELCARERFDACVFSGKRTYPARAALPPSVPVVADLCDATSARLRGSLRTAKPARVPLLALDLLQVRRVERRLVADSGRLLFASARDRDEILPPGDAARSKAVVVPNGVDLDYWDRGDAALGTTIVFTGAMDYPPNADAAAHLVQEVLPIVRRDEPSASVVIAGRDPGPRLRELGERVDGVTVTGRVDDLRPYVRDAAVYAAPLRQGAGIQNKVLEAMAMGVPVVASPIAADGVRAEGAGDPPVVVADGAAPAADAIVAALRRARADAAPDAQGREYVRAHFSWGRSGELVDAALRAVTEGITSR